MSIIELNGVTKTYTSGPSELTVLEDITVSFEHGSTTVVSGASGSGKSTLLNLVAGLDSVSQGTINVAGRPVHSLSEAELTEYRSLELGFIFQFHHLLNDFTALENVMLPRFMTGAPRDVAVAAAADLIDEVGLTDRAHHYPVELSGGERQRIALARALVNQPSIILADEPTGNLDEDNSTQVEALLADLVRSHGVTLVLVTHDQRLLTLGDRRLHLDHGRLHPV